MDPDELYFVSYKDFVKNNPNFVGIEKELREIRYEHFEEKRKDKIRIAKEERKVLLENPALSLESKMGSTIKFNTSIHAQESQLSKREDSTALKMEQDRLEKIKRKQVMIIY